MSPKKNVMQRKSKNSKHKKSSKQTFLAKENVCPDQIMPNHRRKTMLWFSKHSLLTSQIFYFNFEKFWCN